MVVVRRNMNSMTTEQDDTGIDPRVSRIDLDALRRKLAEEKGFSEETLAQMDNQYRQFLSLKLRFPGKSLVPTRFIDEMWHAHILDTRAYANDCENIFGYFLHHYPYLGVGGEGEKAKLEAAFSDTVGLWARAYGEDYRSLPAGDLHLMHGRLQAPSEAGRCEDHACHVPGSCACRSPGACKDE
jgi:hypothetical protein